MNKKNKTIMKGLIIGGVLVGSYYIYRRYVTASNNPETPTTTSTTTIPTRSKPPKWEFYDNDFFDGAVGFKGKTSHKFLVGDTIVISQRYPFTNPEYNGTATVTKVPDDYTVIIDKHFRKSTPPQGGFIEFLS